MYTILYTRMTTIAKDMGGKNQEYMWRGPSATYEVYIICKYPDHIKVYLVNLMSTTKEMRSNNKQMWSTWNHKKCSTNPKEYRKKKKKQENKEIE